MSLVAAIRNGEPADVLVRLHGVCRAQGLSDLAGRLGDLAELVRDDVRGLEETLARVPSGQRVVQKSAHHLLGTGGKRLRAMCVALAARTGSGFDARARELAVAVELVHAATLLHDDVIDLGERRRGAPAARVVYGNAASIFAGDWLLIDALQRVRRVEIGDVLDRLLAVIEEMIFAESLQLEARGRVDTCAETYFRVVEGKTASLFRWATYAGGRAGGLDDDACVALERYGLHLGVAFQLVDDLLDYAGDATTLGKEPLADLREGKMTYPLLVAIERMPALLGAIEEVVAERGDGEPTPRARALGARLLGAVRETGAFEACRALAQSRIDQAIRALSLVPASRARDALFTVAAATVHREA